MDTWINVFGGIFLHREDAEAYASWLLQRFACQRYRVLFDGIEQIWRVQVRIASPRNPAQSG